jgi:hypothetical protein
MTTDPVYGTKDSSYVAQWTTGSSSPRRFSLTRPGSVDGSVDDSKVSWQGNEAFGYGIDDALLSEGSSPEGDETNTFSPVQLTSWLQDTLTPTQPFESNPSQISSRPFSSK